MDNIILLQNLLIAAVIFGAAASLAVLKGMLLRLSARMGSSLR